MVTFQKYQVSIWVFPWVLANGKFFFAKRNPSGKSKNPRVQFLAPPTLHKDPASKTKAKTLTILNRSRYAEITFEWTGGCKMTCWQLDTYIWHFLEKQFHRNIKWVIWLDTYVQGWNGCATSKSPKPLPNEIQSVASSSTWRQMVVQRTKKVHNQRVGKKRKRQANSCKSDKRTAKKAQKSSQPNSRRNWIQLHRFG